MANQILVKRGSVVTRREIIGTLSLLPTQGNRPYIGEIDLVFTGTGSFSNVDTVTTDYQGNYTYNAPVGWTGTLTPADSRTIFLDPTTLSGYKTDGSTYSVAFTTPVTSSVVQNVTVWTAPIGIPAPSFGISESHWMYVGQTYDFGAGEVAYPDAGNGPYTYYVDNTDPGATDSGNTYGTPSIPRLSCPATLTAGSVVEVHGGPYTSSQYIFTSNGTVNAPVFIRGITASTIDMRVTEIIPKGQYVLIECLRGKSFSLRPHSGSTLHHACVRHCEIAGDGTIGSGGSLSMYGQIGSPNSHFVAHDNHIHHNGDSEALVENDTCGVSVGSYVYSMWVTDNHIHHNGGDAIQSGHSANYTSHHLFAGRNLLHDDRENAVDIKETDDVVITQNEMYGYRETSSSEGATVVIHYDPSRIWLIFNRIHSSTDGIVSTGSLDLYIIGNVIYGMRERLDATHSETSALRTGAGIRAYSTPVIHAYFNTIDDVEVGIGRVSSASAYTYIANNNITNVLTLDSRGLHGYHIILESDAENAELHHCLLWQDSEDTRIFWDGATYTVSTFISGSPGQSGKGQGLIQSPPQYVDSADRDFRLLSNSACINTGISVDAFALFNSLYEVNIANDYDGILRPHNNGYDIGAFEYK